MSMFRRMLMKSNVASEPVIDYGDSLSLIYIVEDSDECTVRAYYTTRHSLGIGLNLNQAGFETYIIDSIDIMIKNYTTKKEIYSTTIERPEGYAVFPDIAFEIYNMISGASGTNAGAGGDYFIVCHDEDFVFGERNYYEVNIKMHKNDQEENTTLDCLWYSAADFNGDYKDSPPNKAYYLKQLYKVLNKPDHVTIAETAWHTDAVRE